MKIRKFFTCPLEIAHDIIKGKWKPVIIWQISHYKVMGLAELRRSIPGINEKMLIEHINELVEWEIIDKIKKNSYPLKVEYTINNNRGRKVIEFLKILQDLGKDIVGNTIE